MVLKEKLEVQGNWLFTWRSYLPLIIFPILVIALQDSEYLERVFGNTAQNMWEGFCALISFIGLTVRCITIGYVPSGTSGRNTKGQRAKTLNTRGMYSIVRNPLYLGNLIIYLGIMLFIEVWWFSLIAILALWLYYERIIYAEEDYLMREFGASFFDWAKNTPVFLPRIENWNASDLPFSFKTVLKREYSGLFAITASFFFLDTMADLFAEGKLELDQVWTILFIISLVIYLTLMILKKKTRMLYVEGR